MQPDQNSNGQFFRLHVPSKAQALVGGETLGGNETVVKAADLLVQEKIPFKYTPNEVNSSVSEPLTAPNPDDDIKVAGSIARNKVFEWLPVDHTGTNPFQISSSLTASTRAVSAVASVTLAPSLQERIAGSLLALASGDSLGCNVEFNTPAQIAQKFGVHKDITGGSTGPTHPYEYPKGAVTDDTQMTELLAESLITHPEGNLWDLLNRFIAWIKPNPPGTGSGTRQVLAKAELLDPAKDKPTDAAKALWEANAKNGGGNGSIMRCSPIALLYANKPDKLRQLSLDTCALTHYSPAAKASTLAYNRILAAIINGTAKDHDSFLKAYEDAAKEAEAIDPDTAKAIRDVSQIKDKNTLQTSGYTLHTLQVALWALLNCDTLENAVVTAVNLGGDTDSNGAVTGALFGALQGKNAVPKRWTQCLLNTSQLENLAERLYQTHQKLGTTAS
jgi:ADP-ribosyl-[dinitrogen reductase] hydrolase